MFFFIIFLCSSYYIITVVLKRHPDIVNKLTNAQIVNKIKHLFTQVQQFCLILVSDTVWFPRFPFVKETHAVEVQTPNFEELNQCLDLDLQKRLTRVGTKGIIDLEMALILDDSHLEKSLCSQCGKYLSVLPIKVYPHNVVKCGRCCKENDNGTTSLYENVVKNCLFKCINRYEQCSKLLTFSEVTEHEKECFSGKYDCPKCEPKKFSCNAYELLRHYKNVHPTSILESSKFSVDVRGAPFNKERYLYLKNDIIFFVLVENLCGENLLLSVVSLTPHKSIKQYFSLKFLGETVNRLDTETKLCSSLKTFNCDYFKIEIGNLNPEIIKCKVNIHLSEDLIGAQEIPMLFKKPEETPIASTSTQTTPLDQITGVKLTDEFKRDYPNYELTPCGTALFEPGGNRIELTCSECRCFTGSNVFSCANDMHIMCWECRTKQCKCKVQTGGWQATISSVNKLLLLPCRWNCGNTLPGDRLRNHEAQCVHNYRRNFRNAPTSYRR